MLAELTQIDAMMDFVNGRDISLERDNLISKNNRFSLIEDNEMDRNESASKTTADNVVGVGNLRKENEAIISDKLKDKDDLKNNEEVVSLFEKSDLDNGLVISKAKSDVGYNRNNNDKQKPDLLIQNIFKNKTNAYRNVEKEGIKEKTIKVNLNELKSDPNLKNIIKKVYDETKKLTNSDSKSSKVKQNNIDELNINKNNNNKIISDLKDIYNKSTNTKRNNTIESVKKNKVINKPDSNAIKIRQIVNNNVNGTDINNKTTRIEGNQENINISGRNIRSVISTDINKQILESIHSSISRQGIDKQITVQLNPPELGKVLIKFQERDEQITGFLEVSKSQTRYEVEHALPQIIRNLNESGIQIKKLEVVSTDINQSQQESQESFKEQLFSGDDTGQGNSTNNVMRRVGSDNTGFYDWLSNKSDMGGSVLENIFVGNESINMLI